MPALQSQIHLPDLLEHDLNQYFPYLLQFESIENAKQSEVYKKIKPTVDQILSAVYNANLGDWVPVWCFPFIFWAAKKAGGKFSMRLDWLFGKDIEIVENSTPRTIGNLKDLQGTPLSDHDAIALDFILKNSRAISR